MTKYTKAHAKKDLPKRKSSDNKTIGGKCLIIAGSKSMWGAAVLSATAAARVGAGYVYLAPLESGFPIVKHPDFLLHKSTNKLTDYSAIAIGPGGRNKEALARRLKNLRSFKNVVVDAEALNALASMNIRLPSTWILTPHEGELSRLINISSKSIQKDRLKYLKVAQQKFGCIVLLKGHKSLIADNKRIYEIQSGNPALAKAGTGDVLTGIIAGLLSQGVVSTKAACLGAYLHGCIADQWVKENDVLSLMASDLVCEIPSTIRKVRRKKA